jgi:DNA polymerase I-like protein with 3'-5' exonuclease and polymerase domains
VRVYDILDAGPRNRFCANGKIVSNCMSPKGFARQARIPEDEAERHMIKFFERYPRIEPFRRELWQYARAHGNAIQNIFGRPRRIPLLAMESGKWDRLRAERQMVGSCIQGTAAELTKESIVRIHKWEQQNRTGLMLCSTIHDEISADVPLRHAYEVGVAVKQMMEGFDPEFHPVPIETDDEYSVLDWSEKQKTKYAPWMTRELAA